MTNNQKISLKDIYEVVNRLEDKMDKRLHDVECRVDKMEDLQAKIVGGIGVVGLFVGGLITWAWERIKNG